VERYHQTLKKWPRRERQVTTIEALQRQIDRFVLYYNCDLTCRCAVAVESTIGGQPQASRCRSP
jgi:hypothetical protein